MDAGGQRSRKSVTREDLCEAVYKKVGLSRSESASLVELVLKEITDHLEQGETVKLSSFGSFVVRKKGPRMGRKPHLVHAFKLSNDPKFAEKVVDVVGLYMNPPERAPVLLDDYSTHKTK
jgi:nucleoid DNA-binding protein